MRNMTPDESKMFAEFVRDEMRDHACPSFAAMPCSGAWHERPIGGGWWWSNMEKAWRWVRRDGNDCLIVIWPPAVQGWIYANDTKGGWWGPWTPPAILQSVRVSAELGKEGK